jgi:hypothetical protein
MKLIFPFLPPTVDCVSQIEDDNSAVYLSSIDFTLISIFSDSYGFGEESSFLSPLEARKLNS